MNRGCTLALACAGTALLGGCTVGSGSGEAHGAIFALGCDGHDFGASTAPKAYELDPRFFAGEPIEDIRRSTERPMHRLVIHVQRDGSRIEHNDSLVIDVADSYEVARCVRGQTSGGVPQYDTSVCSWATGRPRLLVGRREFVRASFSPLRTCGQTFRNYANAVAVAISRPFDPTVAGGVTPGAPTPPPEQWPSFIELTSFGGAEQPDLDPEQRTPISPKFKVEFGTRINVTAFRLQLDDERVWTASERFEPIPTPEVGGVLEGFIDFDLERGRAAQTFP